MAVVREPDLARSTPVAATGLSVPNERGAAGSHAGGLGDTGPGAGPITRLGQWLKRHTVVLALLIWVAGVCAMGGCIVAGNLRLWRRVRRARPVTDRWILDLLEGCRRQMNTRREVRVMAVDGVTSPALLGYLRPCLLLPSRVATELSPQELRHVFLHELAHLKRHDILVGWIASLLHVLHWFNPLIALGLKRMRADRELVCDGLALSVLPPQETAAYGRTIVRQIEQLQMSRPRWMLAALSGDRARVRERIAMICQFRKETWRWSPPAFALVGLFACAGLTDAVADSLAWGDYARQSLRTAHQDKHANILRCCIRNIETGKYLVVDGDRVTCDADEPGKAGLWGFRFDEVSNNPTDIMYFYSVATRRYLTSDEQGNLAVDAREPTEAARWGTWPRPGGVWVISHRFQDGYLRLDEQGQVRAENLGRDSRSYWDIHSVWRVKTSDDPRSNPQWQREKIPGLD